MKYSLFSVVLTSIGLACSIAYANASTKQDMPFYAASLSTEAKEYCQSTQCNTHNFDKQALRQLIESNEYADDVREALALSEYEVLVGDTLIDVDGSPALLMEITTNWRGVPIDDLNITQNISLPLTTEKLNNAASKLLDTWVSHIRRAEVLDAERIYQTLGASNYQQELSIPAQIGDFALQQQALYRDPMQGSIARYEHPEYIDAIVDISVYPVSPFAYSKEMKDADLLAAELNSEHMQVQALVERAGINEYSISEIKPLTIKKNSKVLEGYAFQVELKNGLEPVYTTNYLFKKGDKFVKLSGNFPDMVMLPIVEQSIAKIEVPPESAFMRSMRSDG
ncbi:hypothetical protein [Agaribacter flavus]|uniref:Uncharacterized protein n=1 Tax=Agaribacter flavus TaxID=1902781 RepID=A0ABV7FTJ1_9ALTE